MEVLKELFGEGKELTALQMGSRAFLVFFITLILIRIAGKRTFGKKSAFDNIIVIMLGAILSRGVAGVSPFIPTMAASLVLVLIHRALGWLCLYSTTLSTLIKGDHKILYKDGQMVTENLKSCLVTGAEVMEGLRAGANTNNLEKISEIYMESSGQISVVKKD